VVLVVVLDTPMLVVVLVLLGKVTLAVALSTMFHIEGVAAVVLARLVEQAVAVLVMRVMVLHHQLADQA
jgi:hypothetical protein